MRDGDETDSRDDRADGDESAHVVEHHFTCSPCPGCGEPHYIDGCLDCGYGIDGYFPSTSGGDC